MKRKNSFSNAGVKILANTATVMNLMEQNAWEADSCSSRQEIKLLFMKLTR
jgi:hypothetical protein